jgi:hypothetical protein
MASCHGAAPTALLERVIGMVQEFAAEAPKVDDITAMVVRC